MDAKAVNFVRFPTWGTDVYYPPPDKKPPYYKFYEALSPEQKKRFRQALKYFNQAPDVLKRFYRDRGFYRDLLQEACVFALESSLELREHLASLRRRYSLTKSVHVDGEELLLEVIQPDYLANRKRKQSYKTVPVYLPKQYLELLDNSPIASRSQIVALMIDLYWEGRLNIDLTEQPLKLPDMQKKSVRLPLISYYKLKALQINLSRLVRLVLDKLTVELR